MNTIHTDSFAHHVEALSTEWHVPGRSVAAFDQHDITAKVFGFASISPEKKCDTETLFDCASTTKSLTAACIAKLVEAGHSQWTTPVSSILGDDWQLADPTATTLTTVEDILSHRSGMPGHDLSYLGVDARIPDSPRSVTRNLRNLPLTATPRTKYMYCNMIFVVAAHIMEKTSGQSYTAFLKEHFLDRLGMHNTYVQPSAVFDAGRQEQFSTAYIWRDELEEFQGREHKDMPEGQGAGLIQTTPSDYAKWVQAVMTKNPVLLAEEFYDNLVEPRTITNADTVDEDLPPFTSYTSYALGWEVDFYRGVRVVRHDGSETGYGCVMLFVPKFNFGVMIMGNSDDAGDIANVLIMELVDTVLGVPEKDRVDFVLRLRKNLKKWKDKQEELLAKLRKDTSSDDTGYHEISLELKNGQLFVDATDRGFPFTSTFEQVGKSGRKFFGHMVDSDSFYKSYIEVEFELDGQGRCKRVGLQLEEDMNPDLVWFGRNS